MVRKANYELPRSRNVDRRTSVQKKEKLSSKRKISTKLEQINFEELSHVKSNKLQVTFESDHKMREENTYNLRGLPGEMSADQASEGRVRLFQELPGTYYKVVKNYNPTMVSHMQTDLTLEKGATVEVLFVGDQGMLEGRVKDRVGWFPASHVDTLMDTKGGKYGTHRSGGFLGRKVLRREGIPREVKLKRPKKNSTSYGFIIKGAKASAPNFIPTPRFPALQYFDSVDKGGLAEKAGLRPGDFILEFNNEDVRGITHADLVQKIRDAKDGFTLKVMTPFRNTPHVINSTLPSRKLGGPLPPQRNPQTSLSLSRIKSPSLSQINFTAGLSGSEDDATNYQPMTSAGALSLQDLFKPSSHPSAADASQEDESPVEPQATNQIQSTSESQPATPSGNKKLFVGAKKAGLSGKRLCQSELDLRNLGTSTESLEKTEQMNHSRDDNITSGITGNKRNEPDVNGNLLTVNSSSTVSLTVDAIPSGTSTLLEEDEEAEIAAADSRQQIYANISNKIILNHHKPVIKSKSKELPPSTTQVPNKTSLKSAFYNRSKTKKPAPPPPKWKQTPKPVGFSGSSENGSAKNDLPDLKSNLIQSDLALSESTKNESTTISNISNIKNSFKPKKEHSNTEVNTDPQLQKSSNTINTEVQITQKEQNEIPQKLEPEIQLEEATLHLTLPDLPSPDYSDSEPELENSGNDEIFSQAFGMREKHSLTSQLSYAISSHISSKSSYDSIQEAREQSLAELQQSIANQEGESLFRKPKRSDYFTDIDRNSYSSSNNSFQLEAQPEISSTCALDNSIEAIRGRSESTRESYQKDTPQVSFLEKPSVSAKPTPRSSDVIFGSSTSLVTSEKPTQVIQNKFQADLAEALLKRKSRLEFNTNKTSSFVDQQPSKENSSVTPACETETAHQSFPPYKSSMTTSEEPVRDSRASLSRAEPEKELGKNLPKRSLSKGAADGGDEDVDALINQFYVEPPPDTLIQESASSTFQQTCSFTSPSHDQGYESASVSPDSTRSESHLPVSTFLKQRHSSNNNNISGADKSKPSTQNLSGYGDRFCTNQRKGLSELLAEHINRRKQNESLAENENQTPYHAQIRSNMAKEVLTKSQYPKSERLLQLINQPVTSSKPSYLNNVTPAQADGVLPTKKSFQPPRVTSSSFDSSPSASSSARSNTSPKPPTSPTPKTPESTCSTDRNSVSHSYPRFSSSAKPGPLVSTPREVAPPTRMDKPVRAPSSEINSSSTSNNQVAALALDMQPVDDWGVDTVCEWLKSIQMSEYEPQFRSNDIAGSHLKMLGKSDLAVLGINSLGHRLTIEKAIKQLPN